MVCRMVCMINRRGPQEWPPHPGVCVCEGRSVGAGLPGPQTWALSGAGDTQVAGRLPAHRRHPGASAPATHRSRPHPHCHFQGRKFRAGVSGVSKALPRPAQLSPLQKSTGKGAFRERWPGTLQDRPGGWSTWGPDTRAPALMPSDGPASPAAVPRPQHRAGTPLSGPLVCAYPRPRRRAPRGRDLARQVTAGTQ